MVWGLGDEVRDRGFRLRKTVAVHRMARHKLRFEVEYDDIVLHED